MRRRQLVTAALTAAFLTMFIAGVHPLIGEGGAAYRIPMLVVGLVGLGATLNTWWALAFAFVPLLLVILGVGYGADVTDEGVPIFLVLGLLVFAPTIAVGRVARLIGRRVGRRTASSPKADTPAPPA